MNNNHTYREILQQPGSWLKEYQLLLDSRNDIVSYMERNSLSKDSAIRFAGAGTSAFIGNILEVVYGGSGFSNAHAVPTTDILSHPESYLPVDNDLVLISFARSGNSPESVSTYNLAKQLCRNVYHIIITCNADGELARNRGVNDYLILLPAETNDKGLAMTSSFSTMLLAGILFADIAHIGDREGVVKQLSDNAARMLNTYLPQLEMIANKDFKRAVFLGSGELKGVAEESHLKLQELTDGQVLCKHDSFLGFRHGPKAVLNDETLIVYLFSDDEYVQQYERDLVMQINSNNKLVAQVGISQRKIENLNLDVEIVLGENPLSFIPYAFAGQLIGYFKSLALELNPDSPAKSGNIARVVEGVNIYEYPFEQKMYIKLFNKSDAL